MHQGDAYRRVSIQCSANGHCIPGLDPKVEFLHKGGREAICELDDAKISTPGRSLLDEPGETTRDVEVAFHDRLHARSLHFDDHLLAVEEPSAMNLTDGGRREGVRVELGEDLVGVGSQLGTEDLIDSLARLDGNVILQPRELGGDLGRHEVRPSRQELPELDECSTRLVECRSQSSAYSAPARSLR